MRKCVVITMPTRIEVISQVTDTRASVRDKQFQNLGFTQIKNVFLVDVYTIDKIFNRTQLSSIIEALINPVSQKAFINEFVPREKFDYAIEIGYLPGVTDNIANTAREIIEDKLKVKFKNGEGVYTSQITFIEGKISQEQIQLIAESLYNPVIQRAHIKNFSGFKKDGGMGLIVPKVYLDKKINIDIVDLDVSDEELVTIGKQGIANADGTRRGPLALDLNYMKTIRKYFKKLGRNPTDIELESLAQTWSEHCKHTIFADPIDDIQDGLYKTFIKRATEKIRKKKGTKDICVSVFHDNSGAIAFDDDYLISHKVETHNSPSALDPFGGAITGIVGVNRDAIGFGMGAKPIINTYGFCFGDPNDKKIIYRDKDLQQPILSPRRIMDGVIAGVNSGGNCSGIPTPQGFVYFDDRYKGKPLIFVGTVGLIPRKNTKKNLYKKRARPGDYIVMVGGRVGLDGIHGATFSSEALDTGSPAGAVQIGDPITQKKLSDAIVKEARDQDLYTSITDDGAGGLSCSVAEMARESGGCQVALEQVPLKYAGLDPWQIWISESQERMTLAVPARKWPKFHDLMTRRGVEATVIGTFTASGKCVVTYEKAKIMDIDMRFLHDGLPRRPMTTTYHKQPPVKNTGLSLHSLLKSLNITSFEFISGQYDHEVQAGSVVKPLQGRGRINGEASVTRPLLDSPKGVVLSQGLYPSYTETDAYAMAAHSIDTSIRNAVATGADPDRLALLDNFCWCSSNDPARLGQLKQAAQACYDYATAYGTPFIAGKDSMFNDFKGYDDKGRPIKISALPTLLISSIGVIDDVTKAITIDFKLPGDLIYILGYKTSQVDALKNLAVYRSFYKAAQKGLISSAIGVTRGGITVALAKQSMAGMLGTTVNFKKEIGLFAEDPGRIILTINPTHKKSFESMMKNIPAVHIGQVTSNSDFIIKNGAGKKIVDTTISALLNSYKSTFKDN